MVTLSKEGHSTIFLGQINLIQAKNPFKLDLSIPYLSKPMRKAVKFEVVITFQAKTEFCKICNHWLAWDFSSGLGLW